MLSISPNVTETYEKDEYEIYGTPPVDFKPTDPEQIKLFSSRLKTLRKEHGYRLADTAHELGVSSMCISKYENGHIARIPIQHLRRLSVFYEVTPHYLLGYTEDKSALLKLNDKREIIYNQDGQPQLIHVGMFFASISYQRAIEAYRAMHDEDFELFDLISKILTSSDKEKVFLKKILKDILSFVR